MARRFEIDDTIMRQYRPYNAVGTQLTIRLLPPKDNSDPVGYFIASVNDLLEYALQDIIDSDMVGITIQNEVNKNHKPIGISFRRKDQLSGEVIWIVFEKVSQANSRFNALDTLVVRVHSVKMPAGFGLVALKSRGRPLSVMAHLKKSIVELMAEENCLAHALLIAIARVDNDANYKAYCQCRKISPVVQALVKETSIDLTNGGGSPISTVSKNIFGTISYLCIKASGVTT